MRPLLFALLLPGCAATFHNYYEVDFLDGSYRAGVWSCSTDRLKPLEPKLYCYDTSKAVIALPPPKTEAVKL